MKNVGMHGCIHYTKLKKLYNQRIPKYVTHCFAFLILAPSMVALVALTECVPLVQNVPRWA